MSEERQAKSSSLPQRPIAAVLSSDRTRPSSRPTQPDLRALQQATLRNRRSPASFDLGGFLIGLALAAVGIVTVAVLWLYVTE